MDSKWFAIMIIGGALAVAIPGSINAYMNGKETIAKEATKTELYKAIAAASASGDKAASGALIVELEK